MADKALRPRSLTNLMVPLIGALIVAVAWSSWYVQTQQRMVGNLARRAGSAESIRLAITSLSEEAKILTQSGGFVDVPPSFAAYDSEPRPTDPLRSLDDADRSGAIALERLDQIGFPTSKALRLTLSLLPEGDRAAIGRGEPISIGGPLYDISLNAVRDALAQAQADSSEALSDMIAHYSAWSVVKAMNWLMPMVLVALLGLVSIGRLRRSLATIRQWVDGADTMSRRTQQLLEISRRIAGARDRSALAERLVGEARALLDVECAALYLLEGHDLVPLAASGCVPATGLTTRDPWVSQALADPQATILSVNGNAIVPELQDNRGFVAMVAMRGDRAPIGALVIATEHDRTLSADEASLLQLLALAGVPVLDALRHHEANADLVNVDALTGLANRRRLDGDLSTTLRAIMGPGEPVSFAMVDVDCFKKFNDTYGHPAGDALLRQIALSIAAAVRHRDVVYRYGGEEFSVLLPNATPTEARLVAERIRWAVANRAMVDEHGEPVGTVTVSVGVSCRTDLNTEALVAEADAALFKAKRDGRNRVCYA